MVTFIANLAWQLANINPNFFSIGDLESVTVRGIVRDGKIFSAGGGLSFLTFFRKVRKNN